MKTNLDMDCLRTFVTIINLGSFNKAALHLGRSAPAISLQMKRLEDQIPAKLFTKVGRNMMPSSEGERLLNTAQQILTLNDQIIEALSEQPLTGELAIGSIQDFADNLLPTILSMLQETHPRLRLTATVDRTKVLIDAISKGTLDLAIGVDDQSNKNQIKIRTEKTQWLANPDFKLSPDLPVPLVVFESPCTFRQTAITALNNAGRDWEIIFTSPSLSGLKAAIEAGLGITARTAFSFQNKLTNLPKSSKLPKLPSVNFALYTKSDLSSAAQKLQEIIIQQIKIN